jgi:hypothetical protein
VQGAAYAAIAKILQMSFLGGKSRYRALTAHGLEERKPLVDAIGAYWQKVRGIPIPERWYRSLANDRAAPDEWLQAAANIALPVGVGYCLDRLYGAAIPRQRSGERAEPRGESLRTKQHPSVTELIISRVHDLEASERLDDGSHSTSKSLRTLDMALLLSFWDLDASVPILREQIVRCQGLSDQDTGGVYKRTLDQHVQCMADQLSGQGKDAGARVH